MTGYQDGKKYVSIDGTDYDLTSDTVQMFVDTDAKKGSTSGSITEANEVHGYFVKNAYAVKNSSNEIEFILVDTQNNLNINTTEGDITVGETGKVITNKDTNKNILTVAAGTKGDALKTAATTMFSGAAEIVISTGAKNTDAVTAKTVVYVIAGNGDVVSYSVTMAS